MNTNLVYVCFNMSKVMLDIMNVLWLLWSVRMEFYLDFMKREPEFCSSTTGGRMIQRCGAIGCKNLRSHLRRDTDKTRRMNHVTGVNASVTKCDQYANSNLKLTTIMTCCRE